MRRPVDRRLRAALGSGILRASIGYSLGILVVLSVWTLGLTLLA
jgi:hypothetical protein